MRRLYLLPLLLVLLALAPSSHAQSIQLGQPCGAPGASGIATNGTPVICAGNPQVWTSPNGNASGGITSVATLPATCTPGGTNSTVQVTYPPYSVFQCGPVANRFTLDSTPAGMLDPMGFGARGDTRWVFDAVTTNANGIITSATMQFCGGSGPACALGRTTDVGKIGFITCCGTGGSAHVTSTLINPTTNTHFTIVSVDSATQIHVSTNSGSNQTGATLIIGTQDDTTAINAMTTAAWSGPDCSSVYFPDAGFFISNVVLNAPNTCIQGLTSPTRVNVAIRGQGAKRSLLILLPDFWPNATAGNCPQAIGGFQGCIMSGAGLTIRSIGIWGGEYGNTGTHAVALTAGGLDWDALDFYSIGAGGSDTALTGLVLSGSYAVDSAIDGAGNNALNCSLSVCNFAYGYAGDVFGNSLQVTSNAGGAGKLNSSYNTYGVSTNTTTGIVLVNPASGGNLARFNSIGDKLLSSGGVSNPGINVGAGSQANLFQEELSNAGSTSYIGVQTAGTVHACQTTLSGGATGSDVKTTGSGTYAEDCQNTYSTNRFSLVANSWFEGTTLAQANLTAQAANIGATTLFTTPTQSNANVYQMSYDLILTTAGTSGTITVNLICNNGTATATQAGAATITITVAAGAEASGTMTCHAGAATNIQYSTTGIVTPGALQYSLNLRLDPK